MEERSRILIVDDNKENVRVLIEVLKRDYQLNATTDGLKAVEIAKKWNPDVILLDVVMPGISGYDVCMQLRACDETKYIPIIFETAVSDPEEEIACVKLGALDYVTKPINPARLSAKIKNFIEIKNDRILLNKILNEKTAEINKCVKALLNLSVGVCGLAGKGLVKSDIKRCVEYAKVLVTHLYSNVHFSELLSRDLAMAICGAVPFYDIGKADLPEDIIQKQEKLTTEEFEKMKAHVMLSDEAIASIKSEIDDAVYAKVILDTVKYHHERWDGTGYPEGLKGKEIPLGAQIISIIDLYSSLVGKRAFTQPSGHFEAVRVISAESGKGFNSELVTEFLNVQEDFLEITQKYADDNM